MDSIVEIWKELAEKYDSKIALKDETTGYSLSFTELHKNINNVAQIIENLNLKENSKLLLCIRPHPLWHVIDQAIMKNNFTSVLCDYTSNYLELKYFVETMQIEIFFTDNIKLIEFFSKENLLKYIFYIGSEDISGYANQKLHVYNLFEKINTINYESKKQQKYLSNAVVSIVFSSGTGGKSKGVMFAHKNLLSTFYDYKQISCLIKEKTCVNILSLAHMAPKLNEWALLANGNTIIYTDYINYLTVVKKYKPFYLICVPKLLNIIIKQYKEEVLNISNFFQILNNISFYIAYKYYKLKFKHSRNIINKITTGFLSVLNFIGYNCFIKNIVNKFINTKSQIFSFGAFIDNNIENTISAMGLNLMVQYGMTEISNISYTSQKCKRAYSVGKLNPNMDVIITELGTDKKLEYNKIGLIKVKGPQMMTGYYNNEEDTKELFDCDGYVMTGDLGCIDEDGFLFFKGRQKNIIALSNGEKVNPVKIEDICKQSNFVEQIAVVGQEKPYLTAIIFLNKNYIEQWEQDKGIDSTPNKIKDLLIKEVIIDINNLIEKDKFFKKIEYVRKISFIDEPFTIENGLLSKKYTLIRDKIYNKYQNLINKMYK